MFVVPEVSVVARGGEECVERQYALEGEADENDSFIDIMSGITFVGHAETEGWTLVDALARANLSAETLAESDVVNTSHLPTC